MQTEQGAVWLLWEKHRNSMSPETLIGVYAAEEVVAEDVRRLDPDGENYRVAKWTVDTEPMADDPDAPLGEDDHGDPITFETDIFG